MWRTLFMRQHRLRMRWISGVPHNTSRMEAHGAHVITTLQFDNDYIVTGSDDNTVKVRGAYGPSRRRERSAHGQVGALVPLVAAQVWNTQTKRLLRTITGHAGGVWAMQYQGNRLVTGATDRRLHVYDLRTGERIHTLIGHDSTIRCLQVAAPGPEPQFVYHPNKGGKLTSAPCRFLWHRSADARQRAGLGLARHHAARVGSGHGRVPPRDARPLGLGALPRPPRLVRHLGLVRPHRPRVELPDGHGTAAAGSAVAGEASRAC